MTNFFKNSQVFASLTQAQQEELSVFCQQKWFNDGEIIFHEWDDAQAMYLIASGQLDVLKGGEYITTLSSWDIVGEIAFIEKAQKRNATVVSKGESELITIIDFSIQKMFKESPDLYNTIKKIIVERI